MMRKVSQDEIHRIRMCNARMRNQNHLLRCTLRNISTNPYSECGRVLTSVIHHCTKKKCEPKSGEPECSCCCSCGSGPCCRNGSVCQHQQTGMSDLPTLCNPCSSSPTYTSCKPGVCSTPFCSSCQTYSNSYSKFNNRTNSSTVSQPRSQPSRMQQSPQKPRCRSACSDKIACKSATSCNRSVPSQYRASTKSQHRGTASICKHRGCLAATASEPLPPACCCCCCPNVTCKSSATCARHACSHHHPGAERPMSNNNSQRELSPQNARAYPAPVTDRHVDVWTRDKPRPGYSVTFEETSCRPQPHSCLESTVCVCHNQTNNRPDHVKDNSGFLDDNESATAHRPCAKILGELAFQLERRILDYVFGMEGSIRRRFYGYTVNSICQMMNKESKNVCGSDDPLRKSELAFRLKKLLTCLKKVGYNIKVHGDFAQQIVNTYGLLPCPPDSRTIQDFGLHNANCIAHIIDHLACDEAERENLHVLLDSLKYLSKCDSRPLFIW